MILILAAMVVMALITLMLHRNSPLVRASITLTSEPSTTGQRGVVPMRGRRDMEP
jgi:hypothetical protein